MTDHIERTKRMIEVMQAYVDGEKIECRWRGDEEWVMPYDGSPKWIWESTEYRIAKTPDTINWDHVAPEFKYMVRDPDGEVYLYKNVPVLNRDCWSSDCIASDAESHASYRKGTVDWKESLVIRPGCE